eukprot:COSAG01_NODE_6434_length_3669_cov_1.916527_5_plen_86_part_00
MPIKDTFGADLGALMAIAAVWKLLFVGLFLWSSRPKGEMHEKTGHAAVEDGEGEVRSSHWVAVMAAGQRMPAVVAPTATQSPRVM